MQPKVIKSSPQQSKCGEAHTLIAPNYKSS
uniref:Uncharacterized protein n=1 Tax=Arundo donax TaxID=35708 RepID=A0A0A8ZYD2_ARUDO